MVRVHGTTQHKTSGIEELSMAHRVVYGAFSISFTIVRIVWLARQSLMVIVGGAEGKGRSSVHSD